MRSTSWLAGSLITLPTGCGPRHAAPPADPVAPPDTGHSVAFRTMNGGIQGLTESQKCPVTAHFDGVITLSKIGGTLRYRWERSTGANGPVQEVAIPVGAETAPVDVAAAPDEWPVNQP